MIKIGNFLDEWLMEEKNLETRGSHVTAGEQCIVILVFLGKATRKVMSSEYDSMRVGYFERTCCRMIFL